MNVSEPTQNLAQLTTQYWDYLCFEQPYNAVIAGEKVTDSCLFREAPEDYLRKTQNADFLLTALAQIPGEKLNDVDRISIILMARELELVREGFNVGGHLRPSLYPVGPDFNLIYFSNVTTINTPVAAERYVERLATVTDFLADLKACLEAGRERGYRYPHQVMQRAAAAVRTSISVDRHESPLFGPFKRSIAGGSARVKKAGDQAASLIEQDIMPALSDYADFLEGPMLEASRDTISCSEDHEGEAFYRHLVRKYTSVDSSPEEIHELGLAEVQRLSSEINQVAKDAGFVGDTPGYQRFLTSDPQFIATNSESHLAAVQALCKRIDGQIPSFFGRVPRITYTVACIPASLAESSPPAYAQPSPVDNSTPGIFWLTSLTEKCPTYLYPSLALHEAWPGHLMQIALLQEQEKLPKFRRNGALKYTACIEGWAMYCEQLGCDMNIYQTPHEHFGRLNMEMWRAVRLVVDTGIHSRGWSRQQAIDYMADRVSLPRVTVEAEIDRYIALPGQALAYQLGNLKFRELRSRAEHALGDDFDIRQYHDALIAAGPVSLPVLENVFTSWLATASERG